MLIFVLSLFSLLGLLRVRSESETTTLCRQHYGELVKTVDDLLSKQLTELEAIVQRGEFNFVNISICQNSKDGCYFQNPSSPYGFLEVPFSPNEKGVYDDDPFLPEPEGSAQKRKNTKWRMSASEVMVVVGCTPPRMKYFGAVHYIFDSYEFGRWKTVFGSLGDAVNNHNLLTSSSMQSSSPFDHAFILLLGASQSHVGRVIGALQHLTLPIHVLKIPGSVGKTKFRLGLDHYDDIFSIVFRFAFPENEAEWNEWKAQRPITVFRVTPTKEQTWVPYDEPHLLPRNTAQQQHTEHHLQSIVDALPQKILSFVSEQKNKNPSASDTYTVWHSLYSISGLLLSGADWGGECYDRWIKSSCFGDVRDTSYAVPLPEFRLEEDEFVFVYGVNHANTNCSTYNSISIYNSKGKIGVSALTNVQLNNSASHFFPSGTGDDSSSLVGNLYVVQFAYRCDKDSNILCFEIPRKGFPSIAPGEQMLLIERAYVNPHTGVGPSDETIVYPRFLVFKHSSRLFWWEKWKYGYLNIKILATYLYVHPTFALFLVLFVSIVCFFCCFTRRKRHRD